MLAFTFLALLSGFGLGMLSEFVAGLNASSVPNWLEAVNIRGFFTTLMPSAFGLLIVALFSHTPIRAALNSLAFFVGLLLGYYIYFAAVIRTLPEWNSMGFWLIFAAISPLIGAVCWYGRGPQENYIDRKTGARIGKYCMTVGELEHHYMRPQENGHRTDVRKLEIASADGKALRLTATGGKPFAFNCFHYTIDALDKATHIHSFGHMDLTTVCIDEQQRGVGGDMPGSATLRDPYIMHKGTDYKFSFLLETVTL